MRSDLVCWLCLMPPCSDNSLICGLKPLSPRDLNLWETLDVLLVAAHSPGTGVFEASLLSGGEILQHSFIGPRTPTNHENPNLPPVLLCGTEMRMREPKHLS